MEYLNPIEWENIPKVIPSTLASVLRQVATIQEWIERKSSEETIASLNGKIEQLDAKFKQMNQDLKEDTESDLNAIHKDFTNQLKDIHAKLKPPVVLNETFTQTEVTMSSSGIELISDGVNSEDELVDIAAENDKEDFNKPRLLSLATVRKLIFKYLNQSKIKKTLKTKVLPKSKKLKGMCKATDNKIDKTIEQFKLEIQRIYERFDYEHDFKEKVLKEMEEKFKHMSSWSKSLDKEFAHMKSTQQEILDKNEELLESYDTIRQFTKRAEERLKEQTKDIGEDLNAKLSFKIKEIFENLEEMKKLIMFNKDELYNTLASAEQAMKKFTEEGTRKSLDMCRDILADAKEELFIQIRDYRRIYESDLEKFEKSFNQQKYDLYEHIKTQNKEFESIRAEFIKIKELNIEPSSITEARVFTVEARIKEEEKQRLDITHFLKDVFRKLLFTIEQAQVNNMASMKSSKFDQEQGVILFMKRLGFLKKMVEYSEDKPSTKRSPARFRRVSESLENSFMTQYSSKSRDTQSAVH